jgi:MFS family permease
MATIHTVSHCDESELMRRIRPRDDVLIAERLLSDPAEVAEPGEVDDAGGIELVGIAGPFRRYTRTLEWARADTVPGAGATAGVSGYEVRQRIDYQLAIPYWRWLFELPVRRSLPDGLAGDRRPWWSTPDRLSPQQSTMVAAVTLFNLVGGLLYGLLTQVLTFVAADLGDGSSSEQTTLLAVVRIGVVLTMLVMVLADRVGRRRVALASFVASAALTLVTALAPSLWAVGALQFFSRNLAIAGLLCVDTIAVEEMPPGSRAMVAGLGTLAYGLGAGIIVMTLPLADLGDWGWRLTFVVAGMSLPLIWHASRHLPESRRFERLSRLRVPGAIDGSGSGADPDAEPADGAADDAGTVYVDEQDAVALAAMNTELTTESLAPLAAAVDSRDPVPLESGRVNVWRFALVGAIFFLLNVFLAPSSQLQNDYLRAEVGFSGLMISIFVLTTSTPGGIGVLLGGRLADVRGRRWAIVPGLLAIGVFNAIFFSVVGVPMWIASLFGSVIGGLAAPAMSVIAPELFPTARRGTVRGAVAAIAVTGSVVGLLASGRLIDSNGYAFAFTVLAVAPIAAAVIALAIPETRGRELEDINR